MYIVYTRIRDTYDVLKNKNFFMNYKSAQFFFNKKSKSMGGGDTFCCIIRLELLENYNFNLWKWGWMDPYNYSGHTTFFSSREAAKFVVLF